MNGVHGHGRDCRCEGCTSIRCGRDAIAALREPRVRSLIACQIQAGSGSTWLNRTYEVVRSADARWSLDFGQGPLEPRRDWEGVLDWLRSLRPRAVELLEEA